MSGNSWVTLATNDSYSLGALVLARSLKRVHTTHNLTVMITPGVSSAMRTQLASVFSVVEEVNILDSKDEKNLALLTRPDLGVTFTKLHCWRLTQFSKCVFLDADVLVLQNCDELFDREELSAAPDVGWPDCFNSGVFVYRPSIETYNKLINFALAQGSFDGGDQGLLNQFFSDWATKDISRHLPFIYNMCSTATYSYLPAFKQFGQNVKIIHFIGSAKPWLQYLDSETRQVRPAMGSEHLQGLLQLWWDIFCNDIHSTLSSEMVGLAGALSQLTLGVARSPEQIALEEHLRKQAWEHGNIDYMGRDSFDNIWRKICQTLAEGSDEPAGSSADPLPEQSKPASQVSSIVVETVSQGVTPADVPPSLPEPISVASAHKESIDTTLSSTNAEHLLENSSVSTDIVPSDAVSIPSLENISSTSSDLQTDITPEPIPATQDSTPILTSPPISQEVQDSSLENKIVEKDTVSQSAIEIEAQTSQEVVQPVISQDDNSSQKEELQIDDSSNLFVRGEKNVIGEIRDLGQIVAGDASFSRDISSELPAETIDTSALEDVAESIVQKEIDALEELKCVPLESSQTNISSLPSESVSLESSKISETEAQQQTEAAQIFPEAQAIPTAISREVENVSAETADLIKQPVSASLQGISESVLDSSLTQKVTVIGPTPPTTPIDTLSIAQSVTSAPDTLSVDPSIPETPPVSEDTTKDSNLDASSSASKPTPISESQGSSESSQSVDPKAPIPPKRRHKPSQNVDQSGNKTGKSTKSPKGKK